MPVVSFDCYGTLIDWESGILVAMQPVIGRHELVCSTDELLAAYARAESAVEAGPYRPYAEVLRRTFAAMAKDLGFAPQADELETLVEALPTWDPFPDSVAGIRALRASGHRLAVLSNVDDNLFHAGTAATLTLEDATLVTAEQTRCYKPDPRFFEAALTRLGVTASELIHVSASPYHDIVPCNALGIRCVHLRRDAGRSRGAAPALEDGVEATPTWTVDDMAGLVELVEQLKR